MSDNDHMLQVDVLEEGTHSHMSRTVTFSVTCTDTKCGFIYVVKVPSNITSSDGRMAWQEEAIGQHHKWLFNKELNG